MAVYPPSGLGQARPSFVHNDQVGAGATPFIPSMNPQQFGTMANWHDTPLPQSQSALAAAAKKD